MEIIENDMKVKDLNFKEKPYGGWSARVKVTEDIELSVVAGQFAYSSPREDLTDPHEYTAYEIAVFKNGEFTQEFFDDPNDDVVGWVSPEEIESLYNKIKNNG